MRVFAAGLGTETNSFCSLPTTYDDFQNDLFEGFVKGKPGPFAVWQSAAQRHGLRFARGTNKWAYPAGPCSGATFRRLAAEVIAEVKSAGPIDILLLNLHGAMVALDEQDCEGALLELVQAALPQSVIGALIDPHAHLTGRMLRHSSVIVAYKEFPHDDIGERAEELFSVCFAAAKGEASPTMCAHAVNQLMMINTKVAPGSDLVKLLKSVEQQPQILSASFVQGFAWGDVRDVGAKALVVSDGNPSAAERACAEVVAFARRQAASFAVGADAQPVVAAVRHARESGRPGDPAMLCESADNITGGGSGDATHLLVEVVRQCGAEACFAPLWDPVAVMIAMKAGVGATLPLRLGGKSGACAGSPIDVDVEVCAVRLQHRHTVTETFGFAAGNTVHVRSGAGTDILLSELRFPILSPSLFEDFGIDLGQKTVIAIKGFQMARVQFSRVGSRFVNILTAGAMGAALADLPYRNVPSELRARLR
jgi:microcystin degradation protein MlrC